MPEIEAIATATLLELESEGFTVIPTARAARLTMDREGIRRLAARELGLRDLALPLRATAAEYAAAVAGARVPVRRQAGDVVLGKGQSVVRETAPTCEHAWDYAQAGRSRRRGHA